MKQDSRCTERPDFKNAPFPREQKLIKRGTNKGLLSRRLFAEAVGPARSHPPHRHTPKSNPMLSIRKINLV